MKRQDFMSLSLHLKKMLERVRKVYKSGIDLYCQFTGSRSVIQK